MRIIGVLMGLILVASPRIMYSMSEKVIDTESIHVTAKRQESVVIPRAVSLLSIGAGMV